MRVVPRAGGLVLGLALASCVSENELSLPAPPAGYPIAYAAATCAPADGPAVRLFLAAEPTEALPPASPFVELAVWHGVASLSNREFEWAGSSSDGVARRCDVTGACEEATQVHLRFRPVGDDTTVTGTLTLTFPGGSTVGGGFSAAWRPTRQFCG